MHIIGPTGSGKTTLLKNLIVQDFQAGHGVAVIDPKGGMVEELLAHVPPDRIDDVIVFDPTDREWSVGFNMLEKVEPNMRSRAADEFVMAFKKIHEGDWGVRLDRVLRYAAMALLDVPSSTVLEVENLLLDEDYRQNILAEVTNPKVATFWDTRYPQMTRGGLLEQVTTPILNRIDPMLMYPEVGRIVGQAQGTFSLREVVDQSKILLVNLAEAEIGEGLSKFLGALLVSKIQMAAMSSVASAAERPPLFLYIDEFQNFLTSAFDKIVTEARSFGLGLIVANQFPEQLSRQLQLALDHNVAVRLNCIERNDRHRYWICFQRPQLQQAYYTTQQKLPYQCDGHWVYPLPPLGLGDPNMARIVRDRSRRKYAIPAKAFEMITQQQSDGSSPPRDRHRASKDWSPEDFFDEE
jgi:hypothetical protein